MALLNGTAIGLIQDLVYFRAVTQELRALPISEDYWRHVASRVGKFEQRWAEGKQRDQKSCAGSD